MQSFSADSSFKEYRLEPYDLSNGAVIFMGGVAIPYHTL